MPQSTWATMQERHWPWAAEASSSKRIQRYSCNNSMQLSAAQLWKTRGWKAGNVSEELGTAFDCHRGSYGDMFCYASLIIPARGIASLLFNLLCIMSCAPCFGQTGGGDLALWECFEGWPWWHHVEWIWFYFAKVLSFKTMPGFIRFHRICHLAWLAWVVCGSCW